MSENCPNRGTKMKDIFIHVCEHCQKRIELNWKKIVPFDPIGGSFAICPECKETMYIPPNRR